MTTPRHAPLRAGLLRGEPAHGMEAHTLAHPQVDPSSVVKFADVSEFQKNVQASYLKWSQAAIIRAAYGDQHDDHAWYGGARRDFFHANGSRYLGIYQYIVAGQSIISQAKALCRLVGTMRKGEDLWADIEEGSGNLQQSWQQWANVVHDTLGWAPSSYSGLYFARDHGLQPVKWVAAYGNTEPSVPHEFWQFSSSYPIPGVGTGDCSLFHGSMDDLAALAYGGTPAQKPAGHPTLQLNMTGQAVRDLQNALVKLGLLHGNQVDGSFGPVTKAAVEAAQRRFGFKGKDVDGIAGPKTWAKLT